MGLFNRNRTNPDDEQNHDNRVEVVVHQNATKEAAAEAKDANKKLNKLLIENGFTLKIYLAAGGQVKQKKGKA